MGHSDNSVHASYGAGLIPLIDMQNAIEKVQYNFIKLP